MIEAVSVVRLEAKRAPTQDGTRHPLRRYEGAVALDSLYHERLPCATVRLEELVDAL